MDALLQLANFISPTIWERTIQSPKQKTNQLYIQIRSGKIKTLEDIAQKNFPIPNNQYASNLKFRLKERLIACLFLMPKDDDSDIQKAWWECNRNVAAVRYLSAKSQKKAAIQIALDTLKKCEHFDYTEKSLELCRELYLYYSTAIGDFKKTQEYKLKVKQYIKLHNAEAEAEMYYGELMTQILKHKQNTDRALEIATEATSVLTSYLGSLASYKLNLIAYSIILTKFQLLDDHHSVINHCKKAVSYFQTRPFKTPYTTTFLFLFQMIPSLLSLEKFEEAKDTLDIALTLPPIGTPNWQLIAHYKALTGFYSNDFQSAYEIYLIAEQNPPQLQLHKENWRIYYAYIVFFIKIGKIQSDRKRFRLGKFLNDVPKYAKDKRGMNVAILIIQILHLLQSKKYDDIIDRTSALSRYSSRYLRKDNNFRSNCFIKMLLCLEKGNFHPIAVTRHAQPFIEKLKSSKSDLQNQGSKEVEIVPYEVLWEIGVMGLLHQKKR